VRAAAFMIQPDYVRLRWWIPRYYWIASLMRYDVLRDREATYVLSELLNSVKPPIAQLLKIIGGKVAVVFGAGPTLDEMLVRLINSGCMDLIKERCSLISADGATQALLEHGVVPDVVVTDLDGSVESIIESGLKGSVVVVHGHGDNVMSLLKYVEELKKVTRKLIGTTQVEPRYPVLNFGGFTDGDRAVFLAEYFTASKVLMVGMDFGDVVGRRSKPWLKRDARASEDKLLKLKIAEELISWLIRERGVEVLSVSNRVPQGVKKIEISKLRRVCSL